jgi:hypothetical protein
MFAARNALIESPEGKPGRLRFAAIPGDMAIRAVRRSSTSKVFLQDH